MRHILLSLLCAFLGGCAAKTVLYSGTGKPLLSIGANAAALHYRAPGITFDVDALDASTATLASGKARAGVIRSSAGLVRAVGTTAVKIKAL